MRTVKIEFIPGGESPAQLSVDGKPVSTAGAAYAAVHRILSRDPNTIIMGPRMSLGPNRTAVPAHEPPYAVKNLQGSNVAVGYSPLQLWGDHWDKILGWGRYNKNGAFTSEDKKSEGLVMSTDRNLAAAVSKLAMQKPELRRHLVPLLRQAGSKKVDRAKDSQWIVNQLRTLEGQSMPNDRTINTVYKALVNIVSAYSAWYDDQAQKYEGIIQEFSEMGMKDHQANAGKSLTYFRNKRKEWDKVKPSKQYGELVSALYLAKKVIDY